MKDVAQNYRQRSNNVTFENCARKTTADNEMLLLDNNDSLFAGDSKDLNTTTDNRGDTTQLVNSGFRNMDSDLGVLSKGFMASSEAQSPSRPLKVFNDHLRKLTNDRIITRD